MGTLAKSYKELTLAEKLYAKRNAVVLLIDVSGSTNRDIEPGCTELQAIKAIVNDLPEDISIYEFADYVRKVDKNTITDKGRGGTLMGTAFRQLRLQGHRKVLMLTDGEASDKSRALEEAKGLEIKILFVGPGSKPPFLDELAKRAGAQTCSKEDLKQIKSLTEKIVLLIEAGKDNSIKL